MRTSQGTFISRHNPQTKTDLLRMLYHWNLKHRIFLYGPMNKFYPSIFSCANYNCQYGTIRYNHLAYFVLSSNLKIIITHISIMDPKQ
jgi:hypothetical protein